MSSKLALKDTIEVSLIYGTMLAYLAAGLTLSIRKSRKWAWRLCVAGLAVVVGTLAARVTTEDIGWQGRFEVFATVGVMLALAAAISLAKLYNSKMVAGILAALGAAVVAMALTIHQGKVGPISVQEFFWKYYHISLCLGGMLTLAAAACALLAGREKQLGWVIYALGFVAAVAAYVLRWHNVAHVPMQNMFEVFLCLGVVMLPLSLFSRYMTKVGGVGADCIMGFFVLFPAGLVFNAEPQKLPAALQSALFIPHVAAYMASYMLMAKASVQACGQLFRSPEASEEGLVSYELGTYKMIRLGFPLLTLGLLLGSVWGKICWGDYWGWDPKELWSLVSWLVYVAYFHFRYVTARRYAWANSALALLGLAAIIITLLWVNLSKLFPGFHSYAS